MTAPTQAPELAPQTNAHIDPAAQVQDAGFVPVQTRSERPRSFDPDDFGAPTGREVNWKHAPVAQLKPLFETAEGEGVGYTFSHPQYVAPALAHGTAPRGEFFTPEDVVSAVAWQGASDALHLSIPNDEEVDEPIVVQIDGKGARADAHLVIEAGRHSVSTVVLRHSGTAQYAQNVEIIVRDGAKLKLVTVQQWDDDAIHASAHQARV